MKSLILFILGTALISMSIFAPFNMLPALNMTTFVVMGFIAWIMSLVSFYKKTECAYNTHSIDQL